MLVEFKPEEKEKKLESQRKKGGREVEVWSLFLWSAFPAHPKSGYHIHQKPNLPQ